MGFHILSSLWSWLFSQWAAYKRPILSGDSHILTKQLILRGHVYWNKSKWSGVSLLVHHCKLQLTQNTAYNKLTGWGFNSAVRALAQQTQGPDFDPWHQKGKKKERKKTNQQQGDNLQRRSRVICQKEGEGCHSPGDVSYLNQQLLAGSWVRNTISFCMRWRADG